MGFEDEAADSGAELTSLKNKQPLFTESEGSPWKAIDLLAEKKKEQWGYEPVQFAVKGAESVVVDGEPKFEIQSPKRVNGSSMARNVVTEPVDGNLQVTALKSTKPDGIAFKKDVDLYPTVTGGGSHMFVENKLVGQGFVADKMLGKEGFVVDKKFGGQGTSAERKFGAERAATDNTLMAEGVVVNKKLMATEMTTAAAFQPAEPIFNPPAGKGYGPINSADAQFAIPLNHAVEPGQFMAARSDLKFAIPAAQGEITSLNTFDKLSSPVTERTLTQMGQPAEQFKTINKAEGGFALKSDQKFEPTNFSQQTAPNIVLQRPTVEPEKNQGLTLQNGGGSSLIGSPVVDKQSSAGVVAVNKFAHLASANAGGPVIEKFALPTNGRSSSIPVEKSGGASIDKFNALSQEKSNSVPAEKGIAQTLAKFGTPAKDFQGPLLTAEKMNVALNAPVKSGSFSIAPLLKQEPVAMKKNLVQTQTPVELQIAASSDRPKFMPAAQKQQEIAEVKKNGPLVNQAPTQVPEGGQKFQPVTSKLGSFNDQGGSTAKLALPVEGKVGGSVPLQKQNTLVDAERVASGQGNERVQTAQGSGMRVDQLVPSKDINRGSVTQEQLANRRQELLTAGGGNAASANFLNAATAAKTGSLSRDAEVVPVAGKKLIGAEHVVQTALGSPTFAKNDAGKKLAAEMTPVSQLPTRFNKNIPAPTQVDKFSADSQLRTQADKIAASGAQIKAQADQSAVKLKGEVVSTNFKVPDQVIATKGANQTQLDAALQPKAAQVKTGAQPMLENGLQTKIRSDSPVNPISVKTAIKQNQQVPAESGLQPRVSPFKGVQQTQQTQLDSPVLQPRVSPLTGKTQQDLVAALKPQDKGVTARNQSADLPVGLVGADRKNAASIVRTGADLLTTPYLIDRGTRMGTAHVISGDVKQFTSKITAVPNGADTLAGDKRAATPAQIAALLNGVKDGKSDISRSPSFERLMAGTVKSTQDRYVGGEFLLASMIIAAGAARRMPDQRSQQRQDQKQDQRPEQKPNTQANVHGTSDVAQTKRGDKSVFSTSAYQEIAANSNKAVKASPFQQMVENISKGIKSGRTSEQTQQIEATRRANSNQGQSDSVRYITGVELAILLAAGGVTRLRSEKPEAQTASQVKDDAAAKPIKGASSSGINFNIGKQPLNAGADMHISTQIVANMSGQRSDVIAPFIQQIRIDQPVRPADVQVTPAKDGKQSAQPTPDLVTRGERCIPGADVAIAAMLMLGGAARRRTEDRFPVNPSELAEKVDRPFRLDRRLGEIVAQARSFVVREHLPITGIRATAANIVASGEVQVPPQYKQGAQEQKVDYATVHTEHQFATTRIYDNNVNGQKQEQNMAEIIAAPTGWVHEPVHNKERAEEATEEKLKKVEQDQQEGAGSGSSTILYRPIWIIAPGETFVSIAEDKFSDGALAWLIADLNTGKFTDSYIEGKRVIEIQCRQRIELPVASDIEEFRRNRKRHQEAENLITIVTASQLDIELKQATFKQFLGTLQGNLAVPGAATLPQIDLVPSPKPARVAPFGITAPQFASIAAAVSLPLIVPQMDMVQQSADTSTVHVQEIRTETAKPEESV